MARITQTQDLELRKEALRLAVRMVETGVSDGVTDRAKMLIPAYGLLLNLLRDPPALPADGAA